MSSQESDAPARSVGMWRDYDTPQYDSDDERLVMDGDVPAGSKVCARMNQLGENMETTAREAMPHVVDTAKSVRSSVGSAISRTELLGVMMSDAAADYFGKLEEEDKSRLEMRIVPTGYETDTVLSPAQKPLRPLLCHALIVMNRGADLTQPFIERVEEETCSMLKPVDRALTNLAFERNDSIGSNVRISITNMTLLLDSLVAALQGPLANFEQKVAKRIAKHVDRNLRDISQWGDRQLGLKYHV